MFARVAAACGVGVLLLLPVSSIAATCQPVVGQIVSAEGQVDVQRGGAREWAPAAVGFELCQRDTIRSGRVGRAAVQLVNESVLRLDRGTTLRLLDIVREPKKQSFLSVLRGAITSFSRRPRLIRINTAYLNGTIEGTEFVLRVDGDASSLVVLEGRVRAENEFGEVSVGAGEQAVAQKGLAPVTRLLVKPRDAVQWSLFYPPILAVLGGADVDASERATDAPLTGVFGLIRSGDLTEALSRLEQVADAKQSETLAVRGAIRLSVGDVSGARQDLDGALAGDVNSELAFALRAIIRVVTNDRTGALEDSAKALALGKSAASRIARSYALQSVFRLDDAGSVLRDASTEFPSDPLVWARLAELELMLGNTSDAVAAVDRSNALAPGFARTQLVRGYVALSTFDTDVATTAFQRAIAIGSSDPMAHLGYGLSRIAGGELAAGRRAIEVAVALDSNSALLRAYLGKAYFEEKRSPLDADQLAVGKSLDPEDPTAYFYSAIVEQSLGNPVAALNQAQAAIDRNDNRAVYRSRLLLDKDRAARGTSLARIYNDLGFGRLGAREATKSLSIDQTDPSAHRFLSDSYRSESRREVARVSEGLQAQLLQEANLNPVQPSVAATNLNISTSGGPGSVGFNEFTPLFESTRAQGSASVFYGSNHTQGGEAVFSANVGRFSGSVGGFRFDTDGFRENNDLSHRIFNAYGQVALTERLNLQFELRKRETEHGDLDIRFDPDRFRVSHRRTTDESVLRLGARFELNQRWKFVGSVIDSNIERAGRDVDSLDPITFAPAAVGAPFPPGTTLTVRLDDPSATTVSVVEEDARQYEAAVFFDSERFDLNVGAAYSRVEFDGAITANLASPTTGTITLPFPFPSPPPGPGAPFSDSQTLPVDFPNDDYRLYAYGDYKVTDSLLVTGGTTFSRSESGDTDFQRLLPKIGVRWQIRPDLQLRAAYFGVVKPTLASNRTVERTQIAGFNQLFDDANSTRAYRWGLGLDYRIGTSWYAGAELTGRDIDSPRVNLTTGVTTFEERAESRHRAYLYWIPAPRWSVGVEAIYDRFRNRAPLQIENAGVPRDSITKTLPLKVSYFDPSGLFVNASASFIDQRVSRDPASILAAGKSDFAVVDVGVGYRLPKRFGLVSLSINNLFDRDFDYQDDGYRNFQNEPTASPYTPERTLMLRFSGSF